MEANQILETLQNTFTKFEVVRTSALLYSNIYQLNSLIICLESPNIRITSMSDFKHELITNPTFIQNAYISGQDCDNHAHQGSIGYNENPGLAEKRPSISFSNGRSVSKRCISDLLYLFIPNLQGFQYLPDLIICGVFLRDLVNGFLLHRVSSIELVSIHFVFMILCLVLGICIIRFLAFQ